MMLDLEIVPERSVGCEQWEFILGMHFSQSVGIIQSQVGYIKSVQVVYSDANPLSTDLEINLTQDGMRLIFDPISQRLKMIEIYNMKAVKLKYCGLTFNSSEVAPSIEQIEDSFGATHPGIYDHEKGIYTLHFRGLSLSFPATKSQSEYYMGSPKYYRRVGGSPTASSLRVYSGGSGASSSASSSHASPWSGGHHHHQHHDRHPAGRKGGGGGPSRSGGSEPFPPPPLPPPTSPPLPLSTYMGQLYLERAIAHPGPSLRLHLYTEGSSRSLEPRKETLVRELRVGDSVQDVSNSLGSPSRLFYKSEDKMKIHCPNPFQRRSSGSNRRSDFFFNYFTLGMDVLFDARSLKAKKFVLHTNYPGHYNFNMYHRCEFLLNLPVERENGRMEGSSGSDNGNLQQDNIQVTAYTKWDTISDFLKASPRPVVLNRASSVNTKNFFGATLCYGYKDLIFEVMPNQHIASVTLYKSDGDS